MAGEGAQLSISAEPAGAQRAQPSTLPIGMAWNAFEDVPFDTWITNFSDAYLRSGLELRQAARILRTRPAEVQAALDLAMLDEESLKVLASLKPARTTWFLLAAADKDALQAAADALNRMSPAEPRPSTVVYEAIKDFEGPSEVERVAAMSSKVFLYAHDAAMAFGSLNEKSRDALKSFAQRIKTGKPLTLKQAAWAIDLFQQLADDGVITDSDESEHREENSAILAVLGNRR